MYVTLSSCKSSNKGQWQQGQFWCGDSEMRTQVQFLLFLLLEIIRILKPMHFTIELRNQFSGLYNPTNLPGTLCTPSGRKKELTQRRLLRTRVETQRKARKKI